MREYDDISAAYCHTIAPLDLSQQLSCPGWNDDSAGQRHQNNHYIFYQRHIDTPCERDRLNHHACEVNSGGYGQR